MGKSAILTTEQYEIIISTLQTSSYYFNYKTIIGCDLYVQRKVFG